MLMGRVLTGQMDQTDYQSAKEIIYCSNDASASYTPPDDANTPLASIGVELRQLDGRTYIKSLVSNSPAFKVGVRRGDELTQISKQKINGWSLQKIKEHLRGKVGSKVYLTMLRSGRERSLTVSRQLIKFPAGEISWMDNVLVFSMHTISDTTLSALQEVLSSQSSGLEGIILDMRDNAGGTVGALRECMNLLLPSGKKWMTAVEFGGVTTPFITDGNSLLPMNIPVVVVVNGQTAAGAEVVALTLRKHRSAKLIGEQMSGYYAMQSLFRLNDGSQLKVKVAEMRDENSKKWKVGGERPDIIVHNAGSRDVQLERAKSIIKQIK